MVGADKSADSGGADPDGAEEDREGINCSDAEGKVSRPGFT